MTSPYDSGAAAAAAAAVSMVTGGGSTLPGNGATTAQHESGTGRSIFDRVIRVIRKPPDERADEIDMRTLSSWLRQKVNTFHALSQGESDETTRGWSVLFAVLFCSC